MDNEKLKKISNSYEYEDVLWVLKYLQNEVADVRKENYSLEARKSTIEIIDKLLMKLRALKSNNNSEDIMQ
jgi:uncharacterized protein (UPF0305 family)